MAFDAQNQAVPQLRWLGVLPSDLARFGVPQEALIPMSPRDLAKGQQLLQRSWLAAGWLEELRQLLRSGLKAELESLNTQSQRFLADHYLPSKIASRSWA
jgi:meiotic recombination protein SPO11